MKLHLKLFLITTIVISLTNCGNIINDYLDDDKIGTNDPISGPISESNYSVAGNVEINGINLDGVKIILCGDDMESSTEIETDSNGFFKFSNLNEKKLYWIYPYKKGFKFSPIRWMNIIDNSKPINLTFNATIEDKNVLTYKDIETNDNGETTEKLKTYEIYNIFHLEYLMGYNELDGNLDIYDTTLKTAEGLRNLEVITGDLRIYAHVNLKNLDGFNNLTTINGDLEIYSMKLKSLESLESLKTVNGKIYITVDPLKISVNDVRNLMIQLDNYHGKAIYNGTIEVVPE